MKNVITLGKYMSVVVVLSPDNNSIMIGQPQTWKKTPKLPTKVHSKQRAGQ